MSVRARWRVLRLFLRRRDDVQLCVGMGLWVCMGLINKGWYGMFVACGIWCLVDVSSVSPSSEQTERSWGSVFKLFKNSW